MRKNYIIQLLFGVAAILLVHSCGKPADISYRHENYTVDDSIANINVSYNTLISQDKDLNSWLAKINDSIAGLFKSASDSLKINSAEDRTFLRADFPPYTYYVTDSIFTVSPKLVSCRYTVYTYCGGAHGITSFLSLNLLPEQRTVLDKEQIFRKDSNSISAINKMLNSCFNRMDCFFETPSLDLVSVVNLNPDGVLFTFDHYVLGPYACGPAEIFVPKDMILPYLNDNIAGFYSK